MNVQVGFTTMSEMLTPEEVMLLLNRYVHVVVILQC